MKLSQKQLSPTTLRKRKSFFYKNASYSELDESNSPMLVPKSFFRCTYLEDDSSDSEDERLQQRYKNYIPPFRTKEPRVLRIIEQTKQEMKIIEQQSSSLQAKNKRGRKPMKKSSFKDRQDMIVEDEKEEMDSQLYVSEEEKNPSSGSLEDLAKERRKQIIVHQPSSEYNPSGSSSAENEGSHLFSVNQTEEGNSPKYHLNKVSNKKIVFLRQNQDLHPTRQNSNIVLQDPKGRILLKRKMALIKMKSQDVQMDTQCETQHCFTTQETSDFDQYMSMSQNDQQSHQSSSNLLKSLQLPGQESPDV